VEVKLYEGNGLSATNDVSITITHSTYGSRTLVCKITRVTEGQSITGKTGPMCYITGEFVRGYEYRQVLNADGSVKSTVAVEVDTGNNMTELWLLTAATNLVNGVYVGPKDEHQSVWEQGLNSYNLVRTRYLFADFAKLGSGVVSGDWLYSQYGKLVYYNGSAYQTITIDSTNCNTIYGTGVAYIHFDGSHPYNDTTGMESGDYRFFPNFAVDLLTGVVYMQAAYVSGTINATDGTIGGFKITSSAIRDNNGNIVLNANGSATFKNVTAEGVIKATLIYSPTANAVQGEWSIVPSFNNPSCYFCMPGWEGSTIVLPDPTTYDGLELSFLTPYGTRQTGSTLLKKNSGHSYYGIHFTPHDAVTINGATYYLPRTGTYMSYADKVLLHYNQCVRVRAINGEWYVTDGIVEATT
jgi:hypothetical protein